MTSADLDEVKPLVLYSEIFRQRPTPQIARTYLERLNRRQFLSLVCALSAIMHNQSAAAMVPASQAALTISSCQH